MKKPSSACSKNPSKFYSFNQTTSIPPLLNFCWLNCRQIWYTQCLFFIWDDVLLPKHLQFLLWILFSYDFVLEFLKCLPSKFSHSPDCFPAFFLKSTAIAVATPLLILFNLSFSKGCVPSDWKIAHLCLVLKRLLFSPNFRPISLTIVFVKLWRLSLYNLWCLFCPPTVFWYIYQCAPDQYGFLARHSTCTWLLATLNEWSLFVNRHFRVGWLHQDIWLLSPIKTYLSNVMLMVSILNF